MSSRLIKILTSIVFLCASLFLQAQFEFGVKAGLNYDSLGELKLESIKNTVNSDGSEIGYHVGFYGNLNLVVFYIRSEIQFTKINSSIKNLNIGLSKLEIPILLGYKILGPLSVFIGPSFQYILEEEVKGISLTKIKNHLTVGAQIGTRLSLGRFGVGIRLERGFTNNDLILIGINGINQGQINTRSDQVILSASYKFKSKSSDEN